MLPYDALAEKYIVKQDIINFFENGAIYPFWTNDDFEIERDRIYR